MRFFKITSALLFLYSFSAFSHEYTISFPLSQQLEKDLGRDIGEHELEEWSELIQNVEKDSDVQKLRDSFINVQMLFCLGGQGGLIIAAGQLARCYDFSGRSYVVRAVALGVASSLFSGVRPGASVSAFVMIYYSQSQDTLPYGQYTGARMSLAVELVGGTVAYYQKDKTEGHQIRPEAAPKEHLAVMGYSAGLDVFAGYEYIYLESHRSGRRGRE